MMQPIDLGDLRRLAPVDASFGLGRGRPVDRHYIESFLERHASDVRGRVLEVGDDAYTRAFGGGRVATSDVLHVEPGHQGATIAADLTDAPSIADGAFDCFVCTQTLTYVWDLPRAMATIRRILAPGGVALVTVPGISQTSPHDEARFGEWWRFTAQSLGRLLGDAFGAANAAAEAHGNVLAATAFLQGLAVEDLTLAELEHRDPRYPLLVTGRAVKR